MNTTTARPYARLGGAELIELIQAGDRQALAEGRKFRSVPSVKRAVADFAPTASTPKAVPTPKPAKVTPKPARKGGRVADPDKQLAWHAAERIAAKRGIAARGPQGGPTPQFMDLYRNCRNVQRQAKAS